MTGLGDDALEHLSSIARDGEPPNLEGDRYIVHDRIGRGAMGEVWRALDRSLDRMVAIKVCADARDAEKARRRFHREARVAARLEHPSVPPIHEIGVLEDGRPWYAMRLVEGLTLTRAAEGVGSRNDRLRLFLKLCEPVAHAHRLGYVHRDLKPDNVMVGPSGEVYVMDWGLAHAVARPDDDGSPMATAAGTPGYMAPEQASGARASPREDVHALGGVLVFLLLLDVAAKDPFAARSDVPRPLRAICARARSIDPSLRYADASLLARDVARFLDRDPVEAYDETLFEKTARQFHRHRFLVLLVASYLGLRMILYFWFRG